jgi:hypothetical protein
MVCHHLDKEHPTGECGIGPLDRSIGVALEAAVLANNWRKGTLRPALRNPFRQR